VILVGKAARSNCTVGAPTSRGFIRWGDLLVHAVSFSPFTPLVANPGCDDLGVFSPREYSVAGRTVSPPNATFELVLRGYSRGEVDRYVNLLLEGQIAALSAERQDNESQLRI